MENFTIPGVDVEGALRRLRGNTKLFARLLGNFLEGAELTALREAFESGGAEEAAKAAHTMKGVAANLSVSSIQKRVLDLELSLKASDSGITAEHREMLEEIAGMYEEIRASSGPLMESVK